MSYYEIFKDLFLEVDKPLDGLATLMSGLAGIATLVFIGYKAWGHIARNEPIDIFPLLKPIIIGILCVNFSTLVIKPIDWAMSPLINYTLSVKKGFMLINSVDVMSSISGIKKNNEDKLLEQESDEVEDEEKQRGGFFKRVLAVGKSFTLDPAQFFVTYLIKFILWLLHLITEILSAVIVAFALLMMKLLALLGPVAFVIGIFPGFTQNITAWISNYVGVYLWIPILHILSGVAFAINNQISSDSFSSLLGLVPCFLVILMYLSVPKIASMIIQGSQATLPNAIGSGAMAAASFGGSVIGALAGKAFKKK